MPEEGQPKHCRHNIPDILQGASACGIAIVSILASNTAHGRLFGYFCVGYQLCSLAHPRAADVRRKLKSRADAGFTKSVKHWTISR